jgi:hypothetical protein
MNIQFAPVKRQFDGDELGEFLSFLEEHELEPEENDGEYTVHTPRSGWLIAYFTETPLSGPPGGWVNLVPAY